MKAGDVGNYTLHRLKGGIPGLDGTVYFAVLEKEPKPEEIPEPSAAAPFPVTYLGVLIVALAAAMAIILAYRRRRSKL